MTATEAREKLEAWRDLLKAKLEGVTPGPWGEENNIAGQDFIFQESDGRGFYEYNRIMSSEKEHGWDTMRANTNFIILSRSAVPAMLAGIEAVLADYKRCQVKEGDASFNRDTQMTFAGTSEMMMEIAEAYEPFFQEIQS